MPSDSIENSLEAAGLNSQRCSIVGLCFLIFLVDGFDIVAMSAAAPAIAQEWKLDFSDLGAVFTTALVGMMVGAIVFAPVADRYGRRKVLLIALTGLCLSVFAVALVSTLTQLLAARLVTGLAIGAILASATSVASEFVPERYRATAVTITVLGYPAGATLVGPVANTFMVQYGWRSIFILGAALTVLILFLTIFLLPESIRFLKSRSASDPAALKKINNVLVKIGCLPIDSLPPQQVAGDKTTATPIELLQPAHRTRTILLWICFFAGLFLTYFTVSWIPTLFIETGMDRSEGITALTILNFSGIAGVLFISAALVRWPVTITVSIITITSAFLILLFGALSGQPLNLHYTVIALIGFTLTPANVGLYAIAAKIYPDAIRATGVGWGIGIGRMGAVAAPILVGFLLQKSWSMYQLFVLFGVPYFLVGWLVLKLRSPSIAEGDQLATRANVEK